MTELVPIIYMVQKGVDLAGSDVREDHQQPHQPEDLNTIQSRDSDNQSVDYWRTLVMELIGGDYPNLRPPEG